MYAPAACAQSGVRSYSKTATDSVAVFEDFLSLFAEVAQTQRCGRLILALLAQRHDDQNDQRDDVGEHLVEFLDGKVGAGGDEDIEDVEPAEQDGGQHADVRTPDREDDERDGEPAAVAEGVVGADQRKNSDCDSSQNENDPKR